MNSHDESLESLVEPFETLGGVFSNNRLLTFWEFKRFVWLMKVEVRFLESLEHQIFFFSYFYLEKSERFLCSPFPTTVTKQKPFESDGQVQKLLWQFSPNETGNLTLDISNPKKQERTFYFWDVFCEMFCLG